VAPTDPLPIPSLALIDRIGKAGNLSASGSREARESREEGRVGARSLNRGVYDSRISDALIGMLTFVPIFLPGIRMRMRKTRSIPALPGASLCSR